MTDRCPAWIAAIWIGLSLGGSPPDGEKAAWAFRAVARPDVPKDAVNSHPIDAFLARRLASRGLAPAPRVDKRTLIRRLTFDLTGLPPTPVEVSEFLRDDGPNAYERLVDRLLASPHHGERWARHWLDLVRYAETHGYERDDPKPNAWKYRDWVVSAINRDLPYDRFLIEQLAGDEVPDATNESRTATGMYRLGPTDDEPADPVMDRFDQLDDMVKTIGTTMLGLTIHCARCHDHKFDPIKQSDYYRMLAFLSPSKKYVRGDDASISVILSTESERERVATINANVDAQIARLSARIAGLGPADNALKANLELRAKLFDRQRPTGVPMTLGLTDTSAIAEPTHRMTRGDAHRPGESVEPGFLSALGGATPAIVPPAGGRSTGRRLALAKWITSPDNPLTARVMVNRIWMHHFGRGIVSTPSDFGAMGDAPADPDLLDWLAREFIARGWSVKAMHRLIVTSESYRRSGAWNEKADEVDPENSSVWRMAPRRLEAEAIRDSALSVSGRLNDAIGGPSVMPAIEKVVLAGQSRPGSGWKVSNAEDASRRSLYVFVKRTLGLPELEVLDAADNNEACPRRFVTTTAPQALALLNGSFFHEQAGHFADRLRREAGDDAQRIQRAFQLAYGRDPTAPEREDSLGFLRSQAKRIAQRPNADDRRDPEFEALKAFCLVLFNTNEFLTVD